MSTKPNPEQRVIDEIDALVDEQLAHPEHFHEHGDRRACPNCGGDWHGLPGDGPASYTVNGHTGAEGYEQIGNGGLFGCPGSLASTEEVTAWRAAGTAQRAWGQPYMPEIIQGGQRPAWLDLEQVRAAQGEVTVSGTAAEPVVRYWDADFNELPPPPWEHRRHPADWRASWGGHPPEDRSGARGPRGELLPAVITEADLAALGFEPIGHLGHESGAPVLIADNEANPLNPLVRAELAIRQIAHTIARIIDLNPEAVAAALARIDPPAVAFLDEQRHPVGEPRTAYTVADIERLRAGFWEARVQHLEITTRVNTLP